MLTDWLLRLKSVQENVAPTERIPPAAASKTEYSVLRNKATLLPCSLSRTRRTADSSLKLELKLELRLQSWRQDEYMISASAIASLS